MTQEEYEDALLAAALEYIEAGLYVFPARVERLESGKKRSQFIASWREASSNSPEQVRAWWGPGGSWRGAHVCLDCGKSQIVVVDADGQEGLDSLAALDLPATPVGAMTPTNGLHVYFRENPRKVVGNTGRTIAPGIDTRGLGGLVFAAPSRDAAGAYVWRGAPDFSSLPVVPDVITDAVRTLASPDLPQDHQNSGVAGGSLGEVAPGRQDPQPFDLPPRQFTEAQAITFCKPYLDALRGAQPGEINIRLNDAAKVLSHFIGPFWSETDARAWLHNALKSTAYDGATWKADDTITSAFRSSARDWRAELVTDPFGEVDQGARAPVEPSAVEDLLAEMLTPDELIKRPPPTPLIMDWLDLDSLAWLIGKPGSYKSFLALDFAAHVGQGVAWRGHPVKQGEVVYLVAEGTTGMGLRVRAWQERHGAMKAIRFLPRPVQASGEEWPVLVQACRQVEPVLIILDTQARVTVGMDENDNTEMGKFIHRAEELRAATGACVLIVHHIGRSGEDARGASALDGAQSTEIKIARSDRGPLWAVVSQDKQKDMAEAEDLELELEVVELGRHAQTGRDLSSLVLAAQSPFDTAALRKVRDWIDNHAPNQAELLGIIADHFGESGGTKAEIKRVLQERRGQDGRAAMAHGSYSDAWAALYDKEIILQVKGTQRFVINSDRSLDESNSG